MNDAELNALKFKVEAASPGRWSCDNLHNISNGKWFVVYATKAPSGSVPTAEDAAFIAAANPSTVRELILDVQRARAERDWILKQVEDYFDTQALARAAKEATCPK